VNGSYEKEVQYGRGGVVLPNEDKSFLYRENENVGGGLFFGRVRYMVIHDEYVVCHGMMANGRRWIRGAPAALSSSFVLPRLAFECPHGGIMMKKAGGRGYLTGHHGSERACRGTRAPL